MAVPFDRLRDLTFLTVAMKNKSDLFQAESRFEFALDTSSAWPTSALGRKNRSARSSAFHRRRSRTTFHSLTGSRTSGCASTSSSTPSPQRHGANLFCPEGWSLVLSWSLCQVNFILPPSLLPAFLLPRLLASNFCTDCFLRLGLGNQVG